MQPALFSRYRMPGGPKELHGFEAVVQRLPAYAPCQEPVWTSVSWRSLPGPEIVGSRPGEVDNVASPVVRSTDRYL
jgi:hypothetical protein